MMVPVIVMLAHQLVQHRGREFEAALADFPRPALNPRAVTIAVPR